MICDVCKRSIEGIWNPSVTKRLIDLETFLSEISTNDSRDRGEPLDGLAYAFGHHKTYDLWRAASDLGCLSCFDWANSNDSAEFDDLNYFSIFYITWQVEEDLPRALMIHYETPNSYECFELVPLESLVEDTVMNYCISPSTADPSSWAIMKGWLDSCRTFHRDCAPKRQFATTFRPTRLLHLQPPNTYSLVEGGDCPSTIEYAALSHCWGSRPSEHHLRLLNSTVDNLKSGLSVQTLPKTFKDAMAVIRFFGIEYIWIDRLCVFQDTPEDWRKEASLMKEVYANAAFSIAALGAKDSDGGLFITRDPAQVTATVLELSLVEGGQTNYYRFDQEKDWGASFHFWDEPLIERSWVVQERLLAPRTLHYGSKLIYWECRQAAYSEASPGHSLNQPVSQSGTIQLAGEKITHRLLNKRLVDGPIMTRLVDDPYSQCLQDWNNIVEYYAFRELTSPKDKLVAISGLAKDMRSLLSQIRPGPHLYLAGHWHENLLDTLMWYVNGCSKKPLVYRAPSWSWTSVDGSIVATIGLQVNSSISLASLISANVSNISEDDTGEVIGGEVVLRGLCANVNVRKSRLTYSTSFYVKSIEHERSHSLFTVGEGHGEGHGAVNRVWFDTVADRTRHATILMMGAFRLVRAKSCEWSVRGLLLKPASPGQYQRLGIAEFEVENADVAASLQLHFQMRDVTIV